ncbi:MATE efflux family protein [Stappia sp. 22II-S9-Z10]|nr:MATE efflux family protein [Stappia sp. 22II-S9-Z10]
MPQWAARPLRAVETRCDAAVETKDKAARGRGPATVAGVGVNAPAAPPPPADPRTRALLEAPVVPLVLGLGATNAALQLAQAAVGLLEIAFIARLGLDALAGAALVFPFLALTVAVSQGAIGGGIAVALARAIGRGRYDDAGLIAWCALLVALGFGGVTAAVMLTCGGAVFAAMGGEGEGLALAVRYAAVLFAGAPLIWTFNALLALVRGAGRIRLAAAVVCGGAVMMVPLSPLLIFGAGPWPGLGIAGGATALLVYYLAGSIVFACVIWGGTGAIRPPWPPRLSLRLTGVILRVGLLSALVAGSTNLTVAVMTTFAGASGLEALAGYGAGARLEILLVPLSAGIGIPAGVIVGTNLGAGRVARAKAAAWVATAAGFAAAEAVGLAAALMPGAWIGLFTADPEAVAVGTLYLTTTGPFYGFFGAAFVCYCAAQATGRMLLPVAGAFARTAVAAGGGALAGHLGGTFLAIGVGMAVFAAFGLSGLVLSVGYTAADSR